MGIHQGLTGELYDRQYSNKALLGRIWDYAKGHRKFIIWMVISITLQGLFAALPPLLISKILDEGIAGIPNETAYTILVLTVIILQLLDYNLYFVVSNRIFFLLYQHIRKDATGTVIPKKMS